MIGDLCMRPEGGVDHSMYHALKTSYTLDDALDLLEVSQVSQSWHAASRRNSDRIADLIRKRNADS